MPHHELDHRVLFQRDRDRNRISRPRVWIRSDERLFAEAMQGLHPAEALPKHLRHRLVWELHNFGWTDLQIAEHTRQTTYTTARIRDFLGLRPNRPQAEGLTA